MTSPTLPAASALPRPRPTLLQGIALLVAAGLLLLVLGGNAGWWGGWLREATVPPAQAHYPYNDFAEEIAATSLLLTPQRPQLYMIDVQLARQAALWSPRWPPVGSPPLPFALVPWAAFVLVPFLAVPHAIAFLLFSVLSMAAAGLAFGLWARWARLPPVVAASFVLAGLASFSLLRTVVLGQFSAFALLAATGALLWLWDGRDRRAGLALAAATLKPHLFVLLPVALLLQGRWRVLAWGAGGVAALLALSVLIIGPQVLVDYPRLVRDLSFSESVEQMQNWRGLFESTLGLREPLLTPVLWASLLAMTALVVATWGLKWKRGQAEREGAADLRWALTIVASLLFSTHLHFNDLLLWAIPAAIGLRRVYAPPPGLAFGPGARALTVALCWTAWLVPALAFFAQATRIGLWFALVVVGLLAWQIRREEAQSDSGPDKNRRRNDSPLPFQSS